MPILKPRNKTLIFRLTEDEYQSLQSASQGSRSLSDFARSRLLNAVQEPAPEEMTQQLTAIRSTVDRLAEQLLAKQ